MRENRRCNLGYHLKGTKECTSDSIREENEEKKKEKSKKNTQNDKFSNEKDEISSENDKEKIDLNTFLANIIGIKVKEWLENLLPKKQVKDPAQQNSPQDLLKALLCQNMDQ